MSTFSLCACGSRPTAHPQSPQQRDGVYRNVVPRAPMGFLKTVAIGWRVLTGKSDTTVPSTPIPVRPLTTAALLAAPDRSLYRLGHSTLLLKLDGEFWLTDPVFSERASPVQWAGPKRFHAPPIGIDDEHLEAVAARADRCVLPFQVPAASEVGCSLRRLRRAVEIHMLRRRGDLPDRLNPSRREQFPAPEADAQIPEAHWLLALGGEETPHARGQMRDGRPLPRKPQR